MSKLVLLAGVWHRGNKRKHYLFPSIRVVQDGESRGWTALDTCELETCHSVGESAHFEIIEYSVRERAEGGRVERYKLRIHGNLALGEGRTLHNPMQGSRKVVIMYRFLDTDDKDNRRWFVSPGADLPEEIKPSGKRTPISYREKRAKRFSEIGSN